MTTFKTMIKRGNKRADGTWNVLICFIHNTKVTLIPKIYEIFKDMKVNDITTNDRKEFIFVVIYLYSPNKFFGGKMPQGMRKAITNAMKTDSTCISRTCTELMILYTTYSDFRQGVDELMGKVLLSVNL